MRPSSRIYYLSGGKLVLAEYHSSQSGQQGAFEASGGYVTSETDRVMGVVGLIDTVHNFLRTADARSAACQVHRLNLPHRLDYLAQVVDPLLDGV